MEGGADRLPNPKKEQYNKFVETETTFLSAVRYYIFRGYAILARMRLFEKDLGSHTQHIANCLC